MTNTRTRTALSMGHQAFEARVARATAYEPGGRPVWGRIPRSGTRCPWTGLSRSYICRLIREGAIESKLIVRPGCITGIRIVSLPSVEAYIAGTNSNHES